MLRLFPWPSPVLHFMRLWLLLLGMETTTQVKAPWVPAPKSSQTCAFIHREGTLREMLTPHRGGQEDPEWSKGLEQGNPQIQWVWPQPLRENEPLEWVASTGLTCCTGKAPHHPSWPVISRSVYFVAARNLREGSLILWKAKVTFFSRLENCFSDFCCLWIISNFFLFWRFRLWFLMTMCYSMWTTSATGQHPL